MDENKKILNKLIADLFKKQEREKEELEKRDKYDNNNV